MALTTTAAEQEDDGAMMATGLDGAFQVGGAARRVRHAREGAEHLSSHANHGELSVLSGSI